MNTFKDRIIRAAKLDVQLYEEVKADKNAVKQAMAVVILSGIAIGIGGIMKAGIGGLIVGTVTTFFGWFVWSFVAFFIGTKVLKEPQTRTNYGELLRVIGFSHSPSLLRIFGIVPGLSAIAYYGALFWTLVATVFAVRQALDYKSTLRAVGVCVISWIIQGLLMWLILSSLGGPQKPA